MPRTSKQVLADQAKQADDDRARKAAPAQLPAVSEAALPATPDTARQRLLNEVAPSGVVGRLAKFDGKAGRFLFVDNDEAIDAAEDFTVLWDDAGRLCQIPARRPAAARAACSTPTLRCRAAGAAK
jgi:hypothetical protein